jgi:ribosomal protein L11 methyltransferase
VIRLAVRVQREHSELVLAELLELTPGGLEESEPQDGIVEYAIYGAPGELPALGEVQAAAGEALVTVSTSELPDDWSERWKRFHHPVLIRSRTDRANLHVRAPWEPPSAQPDTIEIVIDPGQAFGTGGHASTRMCLELLLELAELSPGPTKVLDIGTGSGVLAIAAAKLGFDPVIALDHDPLSVQAARANAAVNDVSVDVRRIDLRREPIPPAPVVLANLLRPLLLDYARNLTVVPRTLIASGLLIAEADETAAAFGAHGMRERARRQSGEWAAVCLSTVDS